MSANFSKWDLVQSKKWPFDIEIKSGDDVVIKQGRYAYSSRDKSIEDVMNAAHFHQGEERENAALANKLQLDALLLVAAAPELMSALEELLAKVNANCVTVGDCNQASAAIAKARGN